MAYVQKDRVKETSTTTGTGTYTLAGAATGFQAFSVIGDGNTCCYAAEDGTDWEVGIGTYTLSGTTLARITILASSNSGSAVNWSSGTRDIFCTLPADKAVSIDESQTLTNKTLQSPTITGNAGEELLSFVANTSAVNQVEIHNAPTGNHLYVRAAGDDANIYLVLEAKGTGRIRVENSQVEVYERFLLGSSSGPVDGKGQLNVNALTSAPSSPDTGDMYLDDGSNTTSGAVNWMWYDGSSWSELGQTF